VHCSDCIANALYCIDFVFAMYSLLLRTFCILSDSLFFAYPRLRIFETFLLCLIVSRKKKQSSGKRNATVMDSAETFHSTASVSPGERLYYNVPPHNRDYYNVNAANQGDYGQLSTVNIDNHTYAQLS